MPLSRLPFRWPLTYFQGDPMRTRLHWMLALSVILALGTAMAGCNTMRGFGRDVERGGERVQDAATDVQRKM